MEPTDDDDLCALDYARLHGICVEYITERLNLENLPIPSDETVDQGFGDVWDTPAIVNAIGQATKERLAITKDAALLLKSVHTVPEALSSELIAVAKLRYVLGLKQELPVLSTDNEFDMLSFGSTAMPDLHKLRIPTELTNEENDEGFAWPSKYFAYPAQCDGRAKAEKLAVSRDALVRLQDGIRDAYVPEDSEYIKAESLTYKGKTVVRQLTPPLLPLSPPLTPYIPSSPANRLPLASDSSNSVAAEAKNLERQIMTLDSPERGSDSGDSMLLDIMNPSDLDALFDTMNPPTSKRKVSDLKVEGPLTPPMFTSSPLKKLKSVSFAETIQHFIPDAPWTDNPIGESNCDKEDENIEFDECFRDIEPLAIEAQTKVENEQLSGADTTARVDIPTVDFSLPVAPWDEYSQTKGGKHKPSGTELDAQKMFLTRIKREDLKFATTWHGVAALERDLRWNIFTSKIASVDLKETPHGDPEWTKMLTELTTGSITTSDSQVWKRDGLRVLDEEEDVEELEMDEVQELKDMDFFIRKRKLEMEEATEAHHQGTGAPVLPTSLQPFRKAVKSHHWGVNDHVLQPNLGMDEELSRKQQGKSPVQSSVAKSAQASTNDTSGLMFGGFSATTALQRFMETRGKTKEAGESTISAQVQLPASNIQRPPIALETPLRDLTNKASQQNVVHLSTTNPEKQPPAKPLPELPPISTNLAPSSFILSSTLLRRRYLIQQIDHLYPTAETIYRDYTLPHSPSPEADILLSPATGLILTTLQQIKQRALPGQPSHSPIKDRMNILQHRYERLLVLVSEGLSREAEDMGCSRPDDTRDTQVLKQFESFAEKLEGEVLVRYIRGGEKALAHAIVREMGQFGLPHGSRDVGDIKPLAVETTWEIFLRRAGLNPFAAQVVIASLKQPFDVVLPAGPSSPVASQVSKVVPVSGLPAFLVMDGEERVRCFQGVMGGSRILKRVGRVLGQEWVSAAHGFRL